MSDHDRLMAELPPTIGGKVTKRLEDLSTDEFNAIARRDYRAICAIREEAFERRAATIANADPFFSKWAADMAVAYGPRVAFWEGTVTEQGTSRSYSLSWLAALAVVRYGEALDHWDRNVAVTGWTTDDAKSAIAWAKGRMPNGVTYIVAEE